MKPRHLRLGYIITAALGAAYIDLVVVHGPAGQQILINPVEITSLRSPQGRDLGHFAKGTRCVIVTADGKYTPVREACDAVRALVARVPS